MNVKRENERKCSDIPILTVLWLTENILYTFGTLSRIIFFFFFYPHKYES